MSTVKALAEVLSDMVEFLALLDDPEFKHDDLKGRLQDIIAAESASDGVKEFGLRCKLHDSEKRCALQLETIRELRADLKYQCEATKALAAELEKACTPYVGVGGTAACMKCREQEEELNKLFEAQKRRELKLQLESDRRAREVAEAMRARCKALVALCDANIDDTNIEALVDGTKHT